MLKDLTNAAAALRGLTGHVQELPHGVISQTELTPEGPRLTVWAEWADDSRELIARWSATSLQLLEVGKE